MLRRAPLFLLPLLLLLPLGVVGGCSCDDGIALPRCSTDKDCEGTKACEGKKCRCVNGVCQVDKSCTKDSECPTGQKCFGGICVPDRCTADKDCPPDHECLPTGKCVPKKKTGPCKADSECSGGKVCCDLGDGRDKACYFPKCLKDEDCGAASKNSCVKAPQCTDGDKPACEKSTGKCVCDTPCGGACPNDKCCDAASDKCVANPKPCPGLSCPAGTQAPDPTKFTVDPKSCKITGPKCECEKLPPCKAGIPGLYSETAVINGFHVVSGYNQEYGDLQVGLVQADGTVKWEWVDGVPSGAKVECALDGPRQGIKEPGPDVGLYTSIATGGNGTIHVSYFDRTNGALKYASKAGGKWAVHTVDSNGTVVGRFTSIALAKDGKPWIAYFVADDGAGRSQLRLASGNKGTPAAASDWKVQAIATAVNPTCGGKCDTSKNELCLEINGKPTCKAPTADVDKCKPKACEKDKTACVGSACHKIIVENSMPALPLGIGLFPSIAFSSDGAPVVAYYDGIKQDLKLYRVSGGKGVTSTLKSTGDAGQWASIAVDSTGKIHIAYIQALGPSQDLKYLCLDKTFKVVADEMVDDGLVSTPTKHEDRVLADCTIAVTAGDVPRIVYQDSSVHALKLAARSSTANWRRIRLRGSDTPGKGAYGYFADQVIVGDLSYISNFVYRLKDPTTDSGVDLLTWK